MRLAFGQSFCFASSLLVLGACANTDVVRLSDAKFDSERQGAIFWTSSITGVKDYRADNEAIVRVVDGKPIEDWLRPIELSAGWHRAGVLHKKYTPGLCLLGGVFGYAYCMKPTQDVITLEFGVEPGHSYMPFALQKCGKNWVWIEDTGQSAAHDLDKWRSYSSVNMVPTEKLVRDVRLRDPATKNVVAGEPPPPHCD